LDFVQESVVLLKHCTVKATFAPAQRITPIIAYRGMEMMAPVLVDEFNHIFDGHRDCDGHRNLLIAFDAATTIDSGFPTSRSKGKIRMARGEG
jgi:hypothetical protein